MSAQQLKLATTPSPSWQDAPRDLGQGSVTDWMAPIGTTLKVDTPLPTAIRLMLTSESDHLVVTDDAGQLVGLVGYRSLIALVADGSYTGPDTVASLVTQCPPTTSHTSCFADALRALSQPEVTCVVVTEGRRPVGLICERRAAHPTLELVAARL